jgi:hypothetical protein
MEHATLEGNNRGEAVRLKIVKHDTFPNLSPTKKNDDGGAARIRTAVRQAASASL